VTKNDLIRLFSPFVKLIVEGKFDQLDFYNPEITQKTSREFSNNFGSKINIFNIEMKFNKNKKRNKGYAFFCVATKNIANHIVSRNWNIFGRRL